MVMRRKDKKRGQMRSVCQSYPMSWHMGKACQDKNNKKRQEQRSGITGILGKV